MRSDSVLLKDIIQAIETIEDYLVNKVFLAFFGNRLLQAAVERNVLIVGEAASNLSKAFQEKHVEIPFDNISKLQNQLLHEPWHVEVKTVWNTCKNDLPELKKKLIETL
ncbi:MAG: HepT-like ribonuclease domain-containing protein [Patescibacteria group bacterium]